MNSCRVDMFNHCTGFTLNKFDDVVCKSLLTKYYNEFQVYYKVLKYLSKIHRINIDITDIKPIFENDTINIYIKDIGVADDIVILEYGGQKYSVNVITRDKKTILSLN